MAVGKRAGVTDAKLIKQPVDFKPFSSGVAQMQIGIVGKPNVGKSTFFSAATMATVEIAPYPFTTIKANRGIGYVRRDCPEKHFGVKCNPHNASCSNGTRFIPVELLDVAGLVPDAWQGKGLGNAFLDELRQADALIHVVDASGGTDADGNQLPVGTRDPLDDVRFLEREVSMWIKSILDKNFQKTAKRIHLENLKVEAVIQERLSGLGVTVPDVTAAMRSTGVGADPTSWGDEELYSLSDAIRRISKPTLIAANKVDVAPKENIDKLLSLEDYIVVPCAAEFELALRKADKAALIKYVPGSNDFTGAGEQALNERQSRALERIRAFLQHSATGVQNALESAAFKLLDLVSVFPVEDENKLTNHQGEVLPDAFLVRRGSGPQELAYKIHTDIGRNYITAINAKTKKPVGHDYKLSDGDVIKIVAKRAA